VPAPEGYEIDDDPARVPSAAFWVWLSTLGYGHRGGPGPDVAPLLAGAWRVVAAYDRATGALVGFARAWSDGVALAYLADVFVEDAHRGRGLGHALVTAMVDEGPGSGFRWMLHTADAHGLYAAHGFGPPDQSYLERPRVAPTGAGYRGT
jgi:GNAT superfamily N-acetyltransferase